MSLLKGVESFISYYFNSAYRNEYDRVYNDVYKAGMAEHQQQQKQQKLQQIHEKANVDVNLSDALAKLPVRPPQILEAALATTAKMTTVSDKPDSRMIGAFDLTNSDKWAEGGAEELRTTLLETVPGRFLLLYAYDKPDSDLDKLFDRLVAVMGFDVYLLKVRSRDSNGIYDYLSSYDDEISKVKRRPFPHFLLFDQDERFQRTMSDVEVMEGPIATASGKANVDVFLEKVITMHAVEKELRPWLDMLRSLPLVRYRSREDKGVLQVAYDKYIRVPTRAGA